MATRPQGEASHAQKIIKGTARAGQKGCATSIRPAEATHREERLKGGTRVGRRARDPKVKRAAIKAGLLRKRGKRWVVVKDVARRILIFSKGREREITVNTFRSASSVGKYMGAVGRFVQSNDLALIEPFTGKSVTDAKGQRHPFETNPNVLHHLANSGSGTFEQVYRIVL